MIPLHWLPFPLRLIMVSPGFVTCDDQGQKISPFSIKTLQQFRTDGFPLTSVLGCETSRNPSWAYLRISQSVNNCHCTSIAGWKLYGQLPTCDMPIRMNNAIGALLHVWAGGCDRTPRPRSIMQLRFSTSWSLNSLNLESNVAPDWLHKFHTQHTTVCESYPHFLSPPLRTQLQLVFCNMCQTQTLFSQTTTVALSVRRPCAHTHVRNKHQLLPLGFHIAIFTLEWEKNAGH